MTSSFDLDWFVVSTVPNQELRARANLGAMGVVCWLPKFSRVVTQRGVRRFVERMLMPSYLFVAFERGSADWLMLRSARGVVGVIACQGRPVRVPADDIADLMARCLTGYFDQGKRRIGAKVRVSSGPDRGVVGKVMSAPEEQRVTVLLSNCGVPSFKTVELRELVLVG